MALQITALMVAGLMTIQGTEASVQCMDSQGQPVDWFVIYKLPEDRDNPSPLVKKGLGHMYLDINSPQWTMSKVSLNQSNHAIAYTLRQIYNNLHSQDLAYAMYNDETPSGNKSQKHGHTKGTVAFDRQSGFWLVHSLPKFPGVNSYTYPWNGLKYGQTFLCISLPYKAMDVIGGLYLYNYPNFYTSNLPTSFVKGNQRFAAAIKRKHVKTSPWQHGETLTSLGNNQFMAFAKYTKFGKDLYDAWVAPVLQQDLMVETWQNGRPTNNLPSNCSTEYKVYNVKKMNLINKIKFLESDDHSKWAVSKQGDWICIGDINRQRSQFHRAGGTVCFKHTQVSNSFRSSINSYEHCK